MAKFDYYLEYKLGKANIVADVVSRRVLLAPIVSMTNSDIIDAIKQGIQHDPVAKQLFYLVSQVKRKIFWVEDGLLYSIGRCIFVPKWGNLRRTLIK